MILGELAVVLGVKADTFTVRDFSKAIGDIPLSIASAITSLAGLSFGFAKMTQEVLDMTTGFSVFTAETGMNTRALQQWQQVAQQAGLSGDVVTGALTSLSSLMAQMRLGHGMPPAAAQALGLLGFGQQDLMMDPQNMLSRIQGAVSGKSPAMATELLKALGISPEMMRVFQTPASVRESLTPTMSEGNIQQMAEFQRELAIFNQTTMKEFVQVLHEIEPYMGDLTEALVGLIHVAGGAVGGVLKAVHAAKNTDDTFYWNDADRAFMEGRGEKNVTINHNVTQNINSNADPLAIADEAARLSKQELRKAASDLANKGR